MSKKARVDAHNNQFHVSGLLFPQMKVSRGAEHLRRLAAEVERFKANDPFIVSRRDDADSALHIYRLELRPAPSSIAIAIGEFAYSLRSALDHLAWQLVLENGKRPSRSSAFPINSDCSTKSQERFAAVTLGMSCEAIDAIRTFQPYRQGDGYREHSLWRLNRLCNLDKHCTVAVGCSDVSVRTSGPPVSMSTRGFENGIELAVPLASKDECNFDPDPPTLLFGNPIDAPGADFLITAGDLAEIQRFVGDEVLPAIAHFFRNAPQPDPVGHRRTTESDTE